MSNFKIFYLTFQLINCLTLSFLIFFRKNVEHGNIQVLYGLPPFVIYFLLNTGRLYYLFVSFRLFSSLSLYKAAAAAVRKASEESKPVKILVIIPPFVFAISNTKNMSSPLAPNKM